MGVQLLRDSMQIEPRDFPNVSPSRFNVCRRGNGNSTPPLSLTFKIDGDEYFARLEDYASALGLNCEELRHKFGRLKNPSKELQSVFAERILEISYRFNIIKRQLSTYGICNWEECLYRALISVESKIKSSKVLGQKFGTLRGKKVTFINTGQHLIPVPTMKKLKKGFSLDGGRVVITKPVKMRLKPKINEYIFQSWSNEIGVLQTLKGLQDAGFFLPGILVPLEIFPEEKRAVFEEKDGDLKELMKAGLSAEWKSSIILQLAISLHFIHGTLGIVHRDLKSANILYTISNGMIEVFFIDWGLSRKRGTTWEAVVGAFGHIPPEYFDGTSRVQTIDNEEWEAWTFGLLLWEISEGTMPDFYWAQTSHTVVEFFSKFNNFISQPEESENSIRGISRRLMRSTVQGRWTVLDACNKIIELFANSPKRNRSERPAAVTKPEVKKVRSAPRFYDLNNP